MSALGPHSVCSACDVRDRALCGALPEAEAGRLHQIAYRRQIPRGKLIYCSDQALESFSVIISGVVKLVRANSDGRQQIVGLQVPGDFVGRPFGELGPVMVEAATDLDLCCLSRKPFENLMQQQPVLERVLLQRTFDELDAARQWMFVLGRLSARAKVASFLQHIAERSHRLGATESREFQPRQVFELPLSRTEMGEYLGLAIETISRQIGQLKNEGIIETKGRRTMRVLDFPRLRARAEYEE